MKLGLLLTQGIPGMMIPGSLAGDFTNDCQDGYQEICSIIVDGVELVCNDLAESEIYMEKGGLPEKSELKKLAAEKIGGKESRNYRQTSIELVADTIVCGAIQILLPVELYANLRMVAPPESSAGTSRLDKETVDPPYPDDAPPESASLSPAHHLDTVLLIDGASTYAPEILAALEQAGIKGTVVSAGDEVSKTALDKYSAVLLLVDRLDEIGCGVVIKVKSTSSVPMLVAAASWTQTEVLKALRYGVDDIIMLPLEGDELVHKLAGAEPLSV
jgi:hypothetical protein